MRIAVIAGMAVLSALAGVAQAKPAAKSKPPVAFMVVDSDRDGLISREEVRYMDDLKGEFSQLDGNADNQLSRGEYSKWKRAAPEDAAREAAQPAR